eukprot:12301909-Alexandrium_andersonii.AAC.1
MVRAVLNPRGPRLPGVSGVAPAPESPAAGGLARGPSAAMSCRLLRAALALSYLVVHFVANMKCSPACSGWAPGRRMLLWPAATAVFALR